MACKQCEEQQILLDSLQEALDQTDDEKEEIEKRYVDLKRRLVNQAALMDRVYKPMLKRIRQLEHDLSNIGHNKAAL